MWYQELHISNELRAYCRKHYKKDYYLYKSIPGIGGITASGILSELGDIRRFNRLDELTAIVGLVPGIYQSSDNRINATARQIFFTIKIDGVAKLSRNLSKL